MNAPLRRPRDSKGRFIADGVAVNDSFQNLLARTGEGAGSLMDGAGYTQSNLLTRRPRELEFMYRGSWIVGATVDAIADDMCRAGIDFSAAVSPEAAQDMQGVTDDLQIWSELADTIRWGRLYGGAIGVILIDGQDLATPLRLETVRRDSFQGIIPLSRWELWPQLDQSLIGNGRIGRPEFYQVGQSATWLQDRKVHNTRVIRMEGVRLPYFQRIAEQGWGMSVIERLFDRLIAYDSTSTGAAQLVYKAYLRTLKVEGLREILSAGGPAEAALRKNVDYIRQFQQNEGITLIDAKDEFEALTYSFAGLDDVLIQFGQQISGATGIPLVRLFGQSPAGLNATGDSDIRLYYDTIASQQRHMLRSPVNRIADILHRSVVGKAPDDGFGYTFNPLWQLRENEKADIALKTAQAVAAAYDDDIVDKATAMRELKQSGAVTGIFATIKEQAIRGEELKPPPLSEMAAFLGNPPGVILPPGLEKEAALITMRKAVAEIVPPIVRYSAPGPLPAVREMTEGVMERLAETPANDLGDIPGRLAWAVNDRKPSLVERVRRIFDADWNESDHPRADNGQFGSGGGSGSKPKPRPRSGAGKGFGTHHIEPGDTIGFKGRTGMDIAGTVQRVTPEHAVVKVKNGRSYKIPWASVTGGKRPGKTGGGKITKERDEHFIEPAKFNAAEYAASHDSATASVETVLAQFPPDTASKITAAVDRLATVEETVSTYLKGDAWDAERSELHRNIIIHGITARVMNEETGEYETKHFPGLLSSENVKRATPSPGKKPVFTLLGGRGGSGKSKLAGVAYDPETAIVLDSDHIKKLLPEYEGWNAAQVHEESGQIFDQVTKIASGMGLNIVHDATMKTPHKAVKLARDFKNLGYEVEAHYMHLPRQEAAKRAVERFLGKTKRLVPPERVLENTQNEVAFEAVRQIADRWSFRDNNVPWGTPPKLISESE